MKAKHSIYRISDVVSKVTVDEHFNGIRQKEHKRGQWQGALKIALKYISKNTQFAQKIKYPINWKASTQNCEQMLTKIKAIDEKARQRDDWMI